MFVTRENGKIVAAFAAEQDFATEELADDNAELVAFQNPPASSNYSIPKLTVVTRLTDTEAETVYPAMAQMPAKLRLVWDTASSIDSSSEFFGTLKQFLTTVLNADRATALLAPDAP
jgi:hypothetical protein